MKMNEIFLSESLKAADLQGKDVPLIIESYEAVDFDDGKKIVLRFKGTERTLVCNKTNANTICDMYGDDLDDWIGQKIILFPTQTDFQGKQVPCIRVRIGTGPITPAPKPATQEYEAAKQAYSADEVPF